MIYRFTMILTTTCYCLCLLGCGSGSPEGMLAASGKVAFSDGSPVTGEHATIVLIPDPANAIAKSASGTIQPDGTFELMTNEPGDGAYPGKYQVKLNVFSNYREQKLAVPQKYASERSSPLSVDLKEPTDSMDLVVEK